MSTPTNAQLAQRIDLLEKQLALLLAGQTKTPDSPLDIKPTKKAKAAKKEASSDDEKPKSTRTSGYIIFSKAMRDDAVSKLSAGGASYKNQDVMTELGAMWKALSDEDKQPWNTKAKAVSKPVVDDVDAN